MGLPTRDALPMMGTCGQLERLKNQNLPRPDVTSLPWKTSASRLGEKESLKMGKWSQVSTSCGRSAILVSVTRRRL